MRIGQCKQTITSPGDSLDNDCDGEIDEERRDGKDNDGDGLVDEDLRKVGGIFWEMKAFALKEVAELTDAWQEIDERSKK